MSLHSWPLNCLSYLGRHGDWLEGLDLWTFMFAVRSLPWNVFFSEMVEAVATPSSLPDFLHVSLPHSIRRAYAREVTLTVNGPKETIWAWVSSTTIYAFKWPLEATSIWLACRFKRRWPTKNRSFFFLESSAIHVAWGGRFHRITRGFLPIYTWNAPFPQMIGSWSYAIMLFCKWTCLHAP